MKRRIVRRPAARSDLKDIASYIAEDNPAAARRLLAAARQLYERLAEMPGIGHVVPNAPPEIGSIFACSIPGFHAYLVFYRFDVRTVELVRVLHGARDIRHILANERP